MKYQTIAQNECETLPYRKAFVGWKGLCFNPNGRLRNLLGHDQKNSFALKLARCAMRQLKHAKNTNLEHYFSVSSQKISDLNTGVAWIYKLKPQENNATKNMAELA